MTDQHAPITLRLLDPQSDFPQIADLLSAMQPEPVTVGGLEERHRRVATRRLQQEMVALDVQGQLVGFSHLWRESWKVAGKFGIEIAVAPTMRRQGIGSQLYANALAFFRQHGATQLEAEIRDNQPESLRFAQQHGFQTERHVFESTLDLASFDETRFAGVIEGAEASGIRFTNLAELGNTLEAQRQLYEINSRTGLDVPGSEQTFVPFERFQEDVFNSFWYRADGQIVALDGEHWIGMSAIGYFPASNSCYNMMTGVDRAYRGRKLALALKLLAIRRAQRYGAAYIRTNNDSENAPMLAINRKLGYEPKPGKYLIGKKLAV